MGFNYTPKVANKNPTSPLQRSIGSSVDGYHNYYLGDEFLLVI